MDPSRWSTLIDDPTRFTGRTVLDLGCRHGRMSSLFGLLGATVLGVELEGVPLEKAWEEVGRWNVDDRVSFMSYDGNPLNIPGEKYDYIFAKSVLVVVPDLKSFLPRLASKLKGNGELIAAENLAGGNCLSLIRRYWTHHGYSSPEDGFTGVDRRFLDTVNSAFEITTCEHIGGSLLPYGREKVNVLRVLGPRRSRNTSRFEGSPTTKSRS